MDKRVMVLYHANCQDGFCAAWVAHGYMPGAEFIPVQYGQDPPDVRGRDVYILDFSYKRSVMENLIRSAAEIVVLDHHKTAAAEFVGLNEFALTCCVPHRFVFDMNKSGGRLAWQQFNGDAPSPWLVDYTEDRDLWRWRLPSSREVSAALASYPRDFALWDRLHDDGEVSLANLVSEGKAILRYQEQQVKSICAAAREVEIDGHKVLAVNTSVLFSEVAGELAAGRPFGAAWFQRSDGMIQWSLRSRDDGIDVSEIAKVRGGGGHRNAAGFQSTVACEG